MNNTLQKPPSLSLFQQIKKKWLLLERHSTLKQKNIETEIRKWGSWVLEFTEDLKFKREHHETAVGICRGNHIILPHRKYRTRKDMIREIYLTEYDLMKAEKRNFHQEVEISRDLCQLEDLLTTGSIQKGIPALENSKDRLSLNQLRYLNYVLDRFLEKHQKHQKSARKILDHELAHLIFDHPRNSILDSDDYKGPNRDEIEKYIEDIAEKEKNRSAVEKITAAYSLAYLARGSDNQKRIMRRIQKEIFARKVDGLMSVYLGPSRFQILGIDRRDIGFFSQFYYKGQLMFEKALEKNTIGLKLKEKGIPWPEIQHELELAEKYKFEGKIYDWPENKFTLLSKNFLDRRRP